MNTKNINLQMKLEFVKVLVEHENDFRFNVKYYQQNDKFDLIDFERYKISQ